MGVQKGQFGDNGYNELTSGTTAGSWYAIKAVDNASATVTVVNRQGDGSTGLVIASGDVIYVTAKSITVTDGKVHAYIEG